MPTISNSDTVRGRTAQARTSIGAYSCVNSAAGVENGRAVPIAGSCYVSAGDFRTDAPARPSMDDDVIGKGPVRIGDGTRLGTRAVVTRDVPDGAIMMRVPSPRVGTRA